jgi:F-type H+-transporting ATPase subunit b
MKTILRSALILAVLAFVLGVASAQEHGSQPAVTAPTESTAQPQTSSPGKDLTAASEAGMPGKGAKEEEEEENIGLKQSPMVKTLGSKLGLGPTAAYWLFWCLNFAVVVALVLWAVKSKVLVSLRERTALIRRSMDEAKKTSEAAMGRLKEIENRLARIDVEIGKLKNQADQEFTIEEQRIKQAAEEDAKRVVEVAELEIASAAKTARRDLKAFAAELAVSLAEKDIQIDSQTDQRLVSTFVSDLGKDGK